MPRQLSRRMLPLWLLLPHDRQQVVRLPLQQHLYSGRTVRLAHRWNLCRQRRWMEVLLRGRLQGPLYQGRVEVQLLLKRVSGQLLLGRGRATQRARRHPPGCRCWQQLRLQHWLRGLRRPQHDRALGCLPGAPPALQRWVSISGSARHCLPCGPCHGKAPLLDPASFGGSVPTMRSAGRESTIPQPQPAVS